jgi:predicted nucleotidyltransferase
MKKIDHKAQRWAKIIGHLPGVAAVFLSGSVAQDRSNKESDIDFFIIAIPGSIWTARFCTNLVLKLTFNLAKPWKHRARICPNHFISADSLEIQEQDAYSAHLFSHNQPLYDPDDLWPLFVEANNWVGLFGEAFPVLVRVNESDKGSFALEKNEKRNLLERSLRWIQLKKIYQNPDFKKLGAKIVLKDNELRFHPDPKNKYWESSKNVDLGQQKRQADVTIEA